MPPPVGVVLPPFGPEVLSLCAFAGGTYSHARRRPNPVVKVNTANAVRITARFLKFTCPPPSNYSECILSLSSTKR
jgi:hypothetical protein